MRLIVLSAFCILANALLAQNFAEHSNDQLMTGMTEHEKVTYINKNFYYLYSASFKNATDLTQWASETAHRNGWPEEEAYANLGFGVVNYLSGKYEEALPRFFRARDLFDSLKNKAGLAAINNEMAVFYTKQKNLDKAFECLDISERLAREINNLTTLGTSLGHRGSILVSQGRAKEARPYFQEVYRIRVETKDSVGLSYVLNDLAEMALHDNNLELANDYLDQSTAIRERIKDIQGVAVNYVNKGENYFEFKQYERAASWFAQGLKKSEEIGYHDLTRHTYDYLSKCYQALGDYKRAFELQEKASAFKDNLHNIERTRIIQEMQARYESDKNQQQIHLLNSENELKQATIERNYFFIAILLSLLLFISGGVYFWMYRNRNKQNAIAQEQKVRLREAQVSAVIESQEKERRRFASDLHDGMGQLISALQLNINSIQQNRSPENRDALFENSEQILTDIHNEIRNIAFNLMPPVLIKEGLISALAELIRRINKSGIMKVTLSHHDIEGRYSELGEISLYRIMQEFLSNVIKYSKATNVVVSFTGFQDEIVVTIEDDGLGYSVEQFQNSEGNGWRNINSRLNLIQASIEFDVIEGRKNNTIVITVPCKTIKRTQANFEDITAKNSN